MAIESVLLVEDDESHLAEIGNKLELMLEGEGIELIRWRPESPNTLEEAFIDQLTPSTRFVITDDDLSKGKAGASGRTLVSWCQERAIPTASYSSRPEWRGDRSPDMFEIRLSKSRDELVREVHNAVVGFHQLRELIAKSNDERPNLSLSELLASTLGKPSLESQFSLYMRSVNAGSSPIILTMGDAQASGTMLAEDAVNLRTWILGYALWNGVLRYPGPILSEEVLAAYCGTTQSDVSALREQFSVARYLGPFSSDEVLFWRDDVDTILFEHLPEDIGSSEMPGHLNRTAITEMLGRSPNPHGCDMCSGVNGGFWCPFTMRAVCELEDCSERPDGFTPPGAQVTRVKREYYDRWAPVLDV